MKWINRFVYVVAVATAFFGPANAVGQSRLSAELRLGATVPPTRIESSGGQVFAAAEVLLVNHIAPGVMAYGGLSYYGIDKGYIEPWPAWGASAGLRGTILSLTGVAPWASAGVLGHRVRGTFQQTGGTHARVWSEPGWGWNVGLGADVSVGGLVVIPAFRFRRYVGSFEVPGMDVRENPIEEDVSHFVLDLGVQHRF